MPTALTLALDQEGREMFDDFWAALDGLGIGDPWRRLDHPAHLTLAVVAEDIAEMEAAALALPAPRSLRLTHLGLFTMPSEVLFLAPLVTAELLETQRRAAAALEGYTLHEHSRPGAWVPHVTLAHPVFGARDLHAFGRIDLPLDVGIAAVELVSFPPARVVARHPLG